MQPVYRCIPWYNAPPTSASSPERAAGPAARAPHGRPADEGRAEDTLTRLGRRPLHGALTEIGRDAFRSGQGRQSLRAMTSLRDMLRPKPILVVKSIFSTRMQTLPLVRPGRVRRAAELAVVTSRVFHHRSVLSVFSFL